MKPYKCYLFDFDGTLFDTADSLFEVYYAGLAAVGQSCTKEETSSFMHVSLDEMGRSRGMCFFKRKRFILAIDKALDYPSSLAKIKTYSDVIPVLEALKRRGAILGIVSGNRVPHIKAVLETFHLASYFSFLVGSSIIRKPKPSGDPIRHAIRLAGGVKASETVYVGDSLQDPETANNGGIAGILLDRKAEYASFSGTTIRSLSELL